MKYFEELKERAKRALKKPPKFSSNFLDPEIRTIKSSEKIFAPISVEEASARYYQVDMKSYYEKISPSLEILSLEEAAEEFPELIWKVLPVDLDRYTAMAFLRGSGGMFLRVKRNSKIEAPISACFSISDSQLQAPHSIIYLEEGAKANVISGCTAIRERPSLHVGITEIYLEEGASLTYTTIHSWRPKVHVRPRNGVAMSEGSKYYEFYVNISEAELIEAETYLKAGEGARASLNSVISVKGPYLVEYYSDISLIGKESGAEIISKALSSKGGRIFTRSRILGFGPGSSGHVECDGMLLDEKSEIGTVPELLARGDEVTLTHEASIGKISEEDIFYLMTKGFDEEEAKGMIVRGFLQIDLSVLPVRIRNYVSSILDKISGGM